MRAAYIFFCFIVGGFCAYYASPFAYDNSGVVSVFVTVYSVFAGFLVAVITILGDPALLPPGGWQKAENHLELVEARLIRHTWLFSLYIGTLALIFVSALVKEAPVDVVPLEVKHWVTRAYIFFGVAAFLLSLALPRMLIGVQRARVEAEIERRRREEGIPPDSD